MPVTTVVELKRVLGRHFGPWAALADLDESLARSSRQAGYPTASVVRLADADIESLAAADVDPLLDVAKLWGWESILANATDSGLRDIGLDDSVRDVRETAMEMIKQQKKYNESVHGVGLATLGVGTIGLDFQAGADDASED